MNLSAADLEFVRPLTAKGAKNTDSLMGLKVATVVKAWMRQRGGGERLNTVLLPNPKEDPIPEPQAAKPDLQLSASRSFVWCFGKTRKSGKEHSS